MLRVSTHADKSALLEYELNILPCNSFAPGQLGASFSLVLPIPLPPDVANAYIYTLPSDLEGMPLSLLEAMSYGNCCLVSDISECTEVVEDKALIFKKSDVNDLREKLQEACDNPEKVAQMKAQAADFI